jgi:hypothetical protein
MVAVVGTIRIKTYNLENDVTWFFVPSQQAQKNLLKSGFTFLEIATARHGGAHLHFLLLGFILALKYTLAGYRFG